MGWGLTNHSAHRPGQSEVTLFFIWLCFYSSPVPLTFWHLHNLPRGLVPPSSCVPSARLSGPASKEYPYQLNAWLSTPPVTRVGTFTFSWWYRRFYLTEFVSLSYFLWLIYLFFTFYSLKCWILCSDPPFVSSSLMLVSNLSQRCSMSRLPQCFSPLASRQIGRSIVSVPLNLTYMHKRQRSDT